jgi:hypothetical protein
VGGLGTDLGGRPPMGAPKPSPSRKLALRTSLVRAFLFPRLLSGIGKLRSLPPLSDRIIVICRAGRGWARETPSTVISDSVDTRSGADSINHRESRIALASTHAFAAGNTGPHTLNLTCAGYPADERASRGATGPIELMWPARARETSTTP